MTLMVLYSSGVEGGLVPGTVTLERALFPDRVWPLEYPVLPCGQSGKNLGFHGFRAGKAEVGLHSGERVRREARPLLQKQPDLVIPIDVVERESDEPKLLRLLGIDRLSYFRPCPFQICRIGKKPALQPRKPIRHRVGAKIDVVERQRCMRAVVALARRSEEHTSELQSQFHLVCRLLLEK